MLKVGGSRRDILKRWKKAAEEERQYIGAGMADLPPPILSDE